VSLYSLLVYIENNGDESPKDYCQTLLLLAGIMGKVEFYLIPDTSQQQNWLTIPEAVSTVMCF